MACRNEYGPYPRDVPIMDFRADAPPKALSGSSGSKGVWGVHRDSLGPSGQGRGVP